MNNIFKSLAVGDAEVVIPILIFYVYLPISLCIWLISGIYVGSMKNPPERGSSREIDWIFNSFAWPYFVIVGIVGLPFYIGKLLKKLY